jgi:hypothetical protein
MAVIEDDIFARPPRSARKPMQQTAHITCRACGLPAQVKPDWPALLCQHCLEDLPRTQAAIADRLSATLARLEWVKEVWQAERAASPALDRWTKVEAAIVAVVEKRVEAAQFARQWALRMSEGGALAELMRGYESYCRETDAIGEELKRLDAAQTELNQAWLNKEGGAF